MEVIHLDVLRTFPTLGFFQEVSMLSFTHPCLQPVNLFCSISSSLPSFLSYLSSILFTSRSLFIFIPSRLTLQGGPYNQTLHDVLGAYACYRPDVGYVQGMSFLAAVLLLNMDACDAFVALANLLNRPSYLAFFRVDHELMQPYFDTFTCLLHETLPRLGAHFTLLEFSPEYYLIEWLV